MRILVLNGGSSSFKCALYQFSALPATVTTPLWSEEIEWDGTNLHGALDPVLKRAEAVNLVGHRIVHGGDKLRKTTRITPKVHTVIATLGEIAPAHNRYELAAIDSVTRTLGERVPQVAVFDTAFHVTLPPPAYLYPVPYAWLGQGIRRYGFHGISYQYSVRRTAELLGHMPARLLLCHLGNGASLCAARNGISVDTTMGFTPLEGLMMGTRSGTIDPGLILHLLRDSSHQASYTVDQLDQILNHESGLLGVSGLSGDMRTVLSAMEKGDARARLTFDVFMHRLAREAGSMIAVLGGLDAIVFTGGIGENSSRVREALCRQISFAGAVVDSAKNTQPQADQNIAAPSSIPVLVIHAEEDWEIARECFQLTDT